MLLSPLIPAMQKCSLKRSNVHRNVHDLLLKIVHVPIRLFFQLNSQHYLADFVFYRAKLWMILRLRNNRKSARSSAIPHSLVHVS